MSPLVSAPRCTPPIPPVEKTRMPARAASNSEDETVVAPTGHFVAIAVASSRSPTFFAGPRISGHSLSSMPTRATPSSTAVIAGTTP
ncbi:unannotated protein [freshwater metagenome]|uniref:Unannotated protein n=1 Tax=freshwater metagenome TaxID=449393 RepID=A0A6J6Y5B6_9ZZZZ